MEFIQFISLIATMAGSVFVFYKLTREDMHRMENKFEQSMSQNEAHWRQMFMYMSKRIDEIANK